MVNKNHQLFVDPHIQYPDDMTLSFEQYRQACQSLIKTTRLDLEKNPQAQHIIEANTPFELRPDSITKNTAGALLIHGLYDSPFSMRDVGLYLQSQGVLVKSILLPGHGTTPGALLNVTYQEWLQTVNYGIHNLLNEVDTIFLVGMSTGATLALYHALTQPNKSIAGIITFSPAIKIYSHLAFAANWHKIISWKFPKTAWLGQLDEDDYVKYQSCTFNSIYQVYLLCHELKKLTQAIPCPLLVAIPQNDRTVCSDTTLQYFQSHASFNSQLILYTNNKNNITDNRIITRQAAYPELNIADFSHVSIPISPDNSHYGEHGDYPFASRIEDNVSANKKIIYDKSNSLDEIFSSLLYNMGITKNLHLRLTFNPDFEFLTRKIGEFINCLEQQRDPAKHGGDPPNYQ